MKYSLIFAMLFSISSLYGVETAQETKVQNVQPQKQSMGTVVAVEEQNVVEVEKKTMSNAQESDEPILEESVPLIISVVGQGVAPMNTQSPAQAYALAKRAAIADAYRLIAEKVKGVRVDGQDIIKNMMVKRSTVRTAVHAMVRNANVVETVFKEGLCEVEMEITLFHSDFAQ
ncbi:hypothetical protein FJR48_03600 [Sulfurimonas lithotrophica]|uniref:Lipoprotein LPP20-like domain-containing protein n=1 Tax=Sulfurimonas lithotrophica TaxID=2590022 RepID=A0A5P8NZR5_9BACT|nr:LPP20 family lipoprotein [Sulfurimonas lithotrophica]QFR48850.1 hypothetical protein FJR48_03600 [Sulfurimonas lithotrophica]